ncbi:MAG: response regulator [Magnetococcales bacterium]|nr:response regulator [Magnetococcales bacterium]MBF0115801.1 response regulator [Magnetococcales bacterium]
MGKKRVLVVDDSSLALMMVRKIFASRFPDWEMIEAKNGDEALTVVGEVHLALLDFNMPGMNGIELAEKLMIKYPGVALYLVTANIQERMQQKADAMGIGFVKKPISEHKLVEIMG